MTCLPGRPALPLEPVWNSADEYVESLLRFSTTSTVFKNLCGGVHILDFLTRTPDLYSTVLPSEWRAWFELIDVHDLLQLLLRTSTQDLRDGSNLVGAAGNTLPALPASLMEYIYMVRIHCLVRSFNPSTRFERVAKATTGKHSNKDSPMPRHIAVGMKPKKMHEVSHFAEHVSNLSTSISSPSLGKGDTQDTASPAPLKLVDFGSGQNYLGRTLASTPYNHHIIAIERKHHNVDGARGLDVHAKLAKKEKIMRNKKEYKRRLAELSVSTSNGLPTPPSEDLDFEVTVPDDVLERLALEQSTEEPGRGSMTHIEHEITDGELESIIYPGVETTELKPPLMTISLHSCGNLTHHALRSILNPSVHAVAAIGCCYNLLTERLGPLTYKHPQLRSMHPRLVETSTAYDPHGFPMSRRLEDYEWLDGDGTTSRGVRMNITARMMAVQAPSNWGEEDSEAFFTRHFYRALLQKVLLDRGVVKPAVPPDHAVKDDASPGDGNTGTPLIVGSLRKSAFGSFRAYVQAALAKLTADGAHDSAWVRERTRDLTTEMIEAYEQEFGYRRKHLAIIWSLMAFSAGVVESLIAVDRWLWLREQECVGEAWVETVFDYSMSPRNLCVVGVKKAGGAAC
ncbi:uncharacterized protein HMPREF1541_10848 [Cyphellophora europaea CBS 101466]|uniref:Methyltransferase domain-containing protein n=1 Tax=Cyphellophora europaea (strain CBS 101466) TaxID=1220924 RepID=W2S7G6_CYPE1|nr:uncharacterized protein HMPREF1541_10848 [Cyphellophora europaea CBS 101466]ETN43983.1 hypothetical protein HMPREF1541_10848 [Cyphellophora europaea CBS 101466]